MSKPAEAVPSPQSPKTRTPQAFDFKRYRTPELAASVTEIVDVRGKFMSGFKTMFLAFAAFLLFAGILFWAKGNLTTLGLALGYSFFAGVVFSLAMAIAGVIKRSLSEMEQLVGLLFTTTTQVANDFEAIGKGDVSLPSARSLVESVYGDVLLPVVEQVVAQSLGFLGTPLLSAYKMTLGRVVRGAIKLVPDSMLAADEKQLNSKAKEIMGDLKTISDEKSKIETTLSWAQNQLGHLGTKARFIVLFPCYVVAAAITLAVLIPLIALYFWL